MVLSRTLLFSLVCLFASASFAEFEKLNLRHVSPLDSLQAMNQRFPWVDEGLGKNGSISNCQELNGDNLNALGASSALTGKPIQNRPQTVFLKWYFDCLNIMSKQRFEYIEKYSDLQGLRDFLPPDFLKQFSGGLAKFKKLNWNELNLSDQEKIVTFNLEKAIGPELVLKDLKSSDTFDLKTQRILKALKDKLNDKKVLPSLRWVVVATLMQPESLRY